MNTDFRGCCNRRWAGLIAAALLLLPCGCHKNVPATVAARPTPAPTHFEVGRSHFTTGAYREAARAFEAYLQEAPDAPDRDQALFSLAMACALAGNTQDDSERARVHLQDFLAQFPHSPYRPQADLLLSLLSEVEKLQTNLAERNARILRLTQELERMKKIDLQRRPSRPPD